MIDCWLFDREGTDDMHNPSFFLTPPQVEDMSITWDIRLDTSEPHRVTAGSAMFTIFVLS